MIQNLGKIGWRKLHIGCGKINIPGWENLDLEKSFEHLDWVSPAHDLSMFEDKSFDLIYASHILEYYDWNEIENIVLPEWNRVLKHRGRLRLAVPNFRKMVELYMAGLDLSYFIGPLYGRMKTNDNFIYHKTTFDEETLTKLLKKTGFSEIIKWDWRDTEQKDYDDYSRSYIPHMDFDRGVLISLNMEATKNGCIST